MTFLYCYLNPVRLGLRLCGIAALLLPAMQAATAAAPAFNVSPPDVYLTAVVKGTGPASQVMVVGNSVANSTLK